MEFSFHIAHDFHDPIFWELWQKSENIQEKPEIIDEASDRVFQKHVTEELEESFKLFDINGDGVISAFELRAGMNSLGKEMSMDEAEEVIELLDENGSGTINFSEFKCVMLDKLKQGTEEEDIKDAFDVFDENKDGLISAKEIQSLFTKLGDAITFEEATDILSGGDLNKDGYIDFEEFKIFCKKMNDQHLQIIKEREEKEDVVSNPKNLDHTSHIIL